MVEGSQVLVLDNYKKKVIPPSFLWVDLSQLFFLEQNAAEVVQDACREKPVCDHMQNLDFNY